MNSRPPRTHSPQEKKALSYMRDRRNRYGENDKSSRKAIPFRKARENRESRRKAAQDLTLLPQLDEAAEAVVESSVRQDVYRVGGWKKVSDYSLTDHLAMQRLLRAKRAPASKA